MTRACIIVALALSAAACTFGPNYHRPPVAMPPAFRDDAAVDQRSPSASLGDVQWFDLFKDEALAGLVRTASLGISM